MVFLVKNSTKKGAKIQNEYLFLLKCIMATSWIGNIYFSSKQPPKAKKMKWALVGDVEPEQQAVSFSSSSENKR